MRIGAEAFGLLRFRADPTRGKHKEAAKLQTAERRRNARGRAHVQLYNLMSALICHYGVCADVLFQFSLVKQWVNPGVVDDLQDCRCMREYGLVGA